MEKKKIGLGSVKEGAKGFIGKTKNAFVNATDQNDDGKFDIEDVSAIASSVNSTVKNKLAERKEARDEKHRENELKSLSPIFIEDLSDESFFLPKFIRVCEPDRKHIESDLCKGSIGYYTFSKNNKYLNIYSDNIDDFGILLFPNSVSEFYLVDPIDKKKYISAERYFEYLKDGVVSELQSVAHSLGAKHFKLSYKERRNSAENQSGSAKLSVKGFGNASADRTVNQSNDVECDVAIEMDCEGHAPSVPALHYLSTDQHVLNLISMMNGNNPIKNQSIMLRMSALSDFNETDIGEIAAVIKVVNPTAKTEIERNVTSAINRYLEYEIDF